MTSPAQLRKLGKAANPWPWTLADRDDGIHIVDAKGDTAAVVPRNRKATAQLIVALRNDAPHEEVVP